MILVDVLPLLFALSLLAFAAGGATTGKLSRAFTRIALGLFGSYIRERQEVSTQRAGEESGRLTLLRSAHMSTTYRVYAARTYLYVALTAIAGSIIGIYVVAAGYFVLGIPEDTLRSVLPDQLAFLASWMAVPELTTAEQLVLLITSNATIGVLTGLTIYRARWWWPAYVASERQRAIDESMERTVAFIYALSRSGMSVPEIFAILTRNKSVYGEAAEEIEVAVRDMDLFGADVIDSLRRLGERTPSEQFKEFSENFVSVLRGGQSVSGFLRDQYEYYQEEARSHQEQTIELLATLAEAYVTVLVAGPLFLITILIIIGLVLGGTLDFLRVVIYALVPLGTVAFVVYLDSLAFQPGLESQERSSIAESWYFEDIRSVSDPTVGGARADGGTVPGRRSWERFDGARTDPERTAKNAARLNAYDRSRWIRERVTDPIATVLRDPTSLLYVTVPVGLTFLLFGLLFTFVFEFARVAVLGTEVLALSGDRLVLLGSLGFSLAEPIRVVDDIFVQTAIFVVGSFAVVYEARRRHIKGVERAVPDFLDRLASVNEAGMPIVESFGRVIDSDLGALDVELDRTWADVQWGAHLEGALYRFDDRINTPMVTRAVALITNAMSASGDLSPILRIAADEAQTSRRLARERRQELMTYLVVIYLSFFVFATIIIAMDVIFLPNIPTIDAESVGGGLGMSGGIGGMGGVGGLDEATKAKYELLFFHAVLVQAVCSGFVAGQMNENSVQGGAKHATVMLALAYVLFLALT